MSLVRCMQPIVIVMLALENLAIATTVASTGENTGFNSFRIFLHCELPWAPVCTGALL